MYTEEREGERERGDVILHTSGGIMKIARSRYPRTGKLRGVICNASSQRTDVSIQCGYRYGRGGCRTDARIAHVYTHTHTHTRVYVTERASGWSFSRKSYPRRVLSPDKTSSSSISLWLSVVLHRANRTFSHSFFLSLSLSLRR